MKKLRILPYKPGSKSAKVIAKALNGLRVRFNGTFRPRANHVVLNWGKTERPRWWTGGFNDPQAVGRSSNKKTALSYLRQHDIPVPEFTDDPNVAGAWFDAGDVVVGRAVLNGHGGIGCRIFYRKDNTEKPNGCPLYTKHLRHKREFRVHVFDGHVIDAVEKRRKRGFENRNPWIRNHDNGYVFCRGDFVLPDGLAQLAINATAALGLDFGAVDIGYRDKEQRGFVFEVNTAPGVEGTTIRSYINAIQSKIGV